MTNFQNGFIIIYGLISLYSFVRGFYEIHKKSNPFGEPFVLFWLGIFVWGDALILGFFWTLISIVSFLLKDWTLFLLIFSIFWVVRSFGEVTYWMHQQFSPIVRNPPETLLGYRFFKNDSIWFAYQIFWQCILTISLVFSILILVNSSGLHVIN